MDTRDERPVVNSLQSEAYLMFLSLAPISLVYLHPDSQCNSLALLTPNGGGVEYLLSA